MTALLLHEGVAGVAYQSKDYGARSPVLDVAIGLLLHGLDLHLLVHTDGEG